MLNLLTWFATRVINIDTNTAGLPNTAVNNQTVPTVFNGILLLAGALSVVFVAVGGIKYSLSQGEPAETQKAKETIIYAIVGLVVVILSFGIVQLFTGRVF